MIARVAATLGLLAIILSCYSCRGRGNGLRQSDRIDWTIDEIGLNLFDVIGDSKGDAYAVGSLGTIMRRNEQGWQELSQFTQNHLTSIVRIPGDTLFVSGGNVVLIFDGTDWKDISDDSVWCGGGSHMWANSTCDIFVGAVMERSGITMDAIGLEWLPIWGA